MNMKAPDGGAAWGALRNRRIGLCFDYLEFVQVCVNAAPNEIGVTADLVTPIGTQNVGSIRLSPESSSADLDATLGGYGATCELRFDFEAWTLDVVGEVCVPLGGCTQGSTTLVL